MALSLRSAATNRSNSQTLVAVTLGDLIIVATSYNNTLQVVSCTDNAGGGTNTYNEADKKAISVNTNAAGHVFYGIAKATETLTITVTAETDSGIHVHVVSGANQTLASVLEAHNIGADGVGSLSHTSASVTTTNANDYLFVFWFQENTNSTMTENGTGFTHQTLLNTHISHTFDKIVSAAGTYSDAVTSSANEAFANIICAFKDPGATGGPFPMFTPGLTGGMRELGGGMQG